MPHPLPSTVWLILLPKPGDSRGTLQQEQQMVYGTDTIRTDTARMKLRSACLSLLDWIRTKSLNLAYKSGALRCGVWLNV